MKGSHLISIIIPAYNAAAVLQRCLQSVQQQTYKNFEAIVVNDGSKDGTAEIVDRLSSADPRFKAIHQHNQGVSAARNKGLDKASGDFVTFIDADDYVKPDYLQKLHGALIEKNADMAAGGYYELSPYAKKPVPLHDLQKFFPQSIISRDNFQSVLFSGVTGVLWGKMFRRDVIEKFRLRLNPEISYSEDLVFVLQYTNEIDNIAVVYDQLYYYDRTGEDGLSSRYGEGFLKNIKLANQELKRHYKRPDLEEIVSKRTVSALYTVLYHTTSAAGSRSVKKTKLRKLWADHQEDFLKLPQGGINLKLQNYMQHGRVNSVILFCTALQKFRQFKKKMRQI